MIALLVMTDGRRDCIDRTLASVEDYLDFPFGLRLIHDDSGDPGYREWLLDRYHGRYEVISTPGRSGFGGAIRSAWSLLALPGMGKITHIFHLEDDFTFDRAVSIEFMAALLDERPELAQVVLRRQPWNDNEIRAGGVIEQHPDAYSDQMSNLGCPYLEHRQFYSTNPCLYRRALIDKEWPDGRYSEGHFTHRLLNEGFDKIAGGDVRFAFWGSRDGGTWVTHIGEQRAGIGY